MDRFDTICCSAWGDRVNRRVGRVTQTGRHHSDANSWSIPVGDIRLTVEHCSSVADGDCVDRGCAPSIFCVTSCTMKLTDNGALASTPTRAYRMEARQEAVESTKERILQAAYDMWLERPYDQVTVDAVAISAGVSRQTVVRHFGSKDGMAMAVVDWQRPHEEAWRAAPSGDVPSAIEKLIDRYETMGDGNVRTLELEGRVPAVTYLLEQARESHRGWVTSTLLPSDAPRRGREREQIILALYAATDVTLWKLLRRDLGQSRPSVEAIIRRMVDSIVAGISTPPRRTR